MTLVFLLFFKYLWVSSRLRAFGLVVPSSWNFPSRFLYSFSLTFYKPLFKSHLLLRVAFPDLAPTHLCLIFFPLFPSSPSRYHPTHYS